MGSEAGLRAALKRKLGPLVHFHRVENSCGAGTPDLEIAWDGHQCWVELKYLARLPRRAVHMRHFTLDQAAWLMRRWKARPGGAWLLVQVDVECYLFPGRVAGRLYKGVTVDEFMALAAWIGERGWSGADILTIIAEYPYKGL